MTMKHNEEINNMIAEMSSNVKELFVKMKNSMEKHAYNQVEFYCKEIVKYAVKIRGTSEYALMDKLMLMMFRDYYME